MQKPKLFIGELYTDERGEIRFVNEFNFRGVKRFYQIKNENTSIIRAWQAHKVECKYFYVASGTYAIAWVKIDDWFTPSNNLKAEWTILSTSRPTVLFLPGGYANGIKAIEPNSLLMVYSNKTLLESNNDRYSFKNENWLDWNNV